MEELNKKLVELLISQAMLKFAIAKLDDPDTTTDKIAQEYAEKIIKELK